MEKVKVFLASSISEFRDLRNEIGDMVRVLQNKLIDEGVVIDLFECEFADNTMVLERMQETYNEEIRKSDIFIMLIGSEIGKYTIEEYEVSREVKDIKRFIFFKGNSNASSIKNFKKELESDDKNKILSTVYSVKRDCEIIDKIEKIILENKRKSDIQLDRKVHLFLAAREEDIKDDKHEIGNFIRNLNNIYLDNHIYFNLITDENLEKFNNEMIQNSEIFFVIFGNSLSDDTLKEFQLAYDKFKECSNPKIATFVRKEDTYQDSVLNFLKMLDKDLGHYYNVYSHPDTIKLNLAMQLNNLGFKKVDLVADNGKIYLEGQEILSTDNIPMFMNNEQLTKFKKESMALEESYWDLRSKVTIDDNKELASELDSVTKRLEEVKKVIASTEKATLNLEISFVKEAGRGLLTHKQIYARKCLENGLLEEAKSVLNLEDIVSDIKEIEKKSGKEEIKGLIQDLILRAETYQLDLENKDRIKEIENSYERAIETEKNNGIPRDTLKLYAEFCYDNKMYEKSASLLEDYYHWAKADSVELDISFYLDLANTCFLAGMKDKSYQYYDILFSLLDENSDSLLYVRANIQYVDLLLSDLNAKNVVKIAKLNVATGQYMSDHHLLNEDIYKFYYSKSLLQLSIAFGDFKPYQKPKYEYLSNSISWLESIRDENIKEFNDYKLNAYDEMIHYYMVNDNEIECMDYLGKEFEILNQLIYTNPVLYEEKFFSVFRDLKKLYEKYHIYYKLEIVFNKYLKALNNNIIVSNSNDDVKESMHKFMVDTLIDQHRLASIVSKKYDTVDGYQQSVYEMEILVTKLKDMKSDYAHNFIDSLEKEVEENRKEYEERKELEKKYQRIKDEVDDTISHGDLEEDSDKKLYFYQTALEILENQELDRLILNDILRVYPKIITIVKENDIDATLRHSKRYLDYTLMYKKQLEKTYYQYTSYSLVARAYDFVGVSYFKLDNYRKALKCFEEAIVLLKFLKGIGHGSYSKGRLEYVNYKMIGTLLKLGKKRKAEELQTETIKELDRLIEENPDSSSFKSIKDAILDFKNQITFDYDEFFYRGAIELGVVDQFRRPVGGVNLTMIDMSDFHEIGTLTTRSDGKVNFYNVPDKKYLFRVNSYPEKYIFKDKECIVSIVGGRVSYSVFPCEKIVGNVKGRVVDDKDVGLGNIKFKIYDKDCHYYTSVTTDDEGNFQLELDGGFYYIQQFNTLDNHHIDDTVYSIDINKDKRSLNTTIVNRRFMGRFALQVKDKKGNPVKNLKVTIFDNEKKEITTKNTNDKGQLGIKRIPLGQYYYQLENSKEYVPFEIIEDEQIVVKEVIK